MYKRQLQIYFIALPSAKSNLFSFIKCAAEGNAIKYICRHQSKGKEEDVKKAIHYLEMILERDYS